MLVNQCIATTPNFYSFSGLGPYLGKKVSVCLCVYIYPCTYIPTLTWACTHCIHTHTCTTYPHVYVYRDVELLYIVYCVAYSTSISSCNINNNYLLSAYNCQTLYLRFYKDYLSISCQQRELFIILHFANEETEAHSS